MSQKRPNEELIRSMAEAAGVKPMMYAGFDDLTHFSFTPLELEHFAQLVAEECAKVCDGMAPETNLHSYACAAAIRAKFGVQS